jgi:chromosome segregation ATPase
MTHYSRLHELEQLPPVNFGGTARSKELTDQSNARIAEHYASIEGRQALDIGNLFGYIVSNVGMLEGLLAALAAAVVENRDRLNQAIDVFKYEIYELWEAIIYGYNRMDGLDNLIYEAQQLISNLEIALETANNNIGSLQDNVTSTQNNMQSLQGSLNGALNSISSLQGGTSATQSSLSNIDLQILDLRQDIANLQDQINAMNQP